MTVKGKGVSGGIDNIYRQLVPFIMPYNLIDGNTWRRIARSQPIVMDCITTLTMYIQGLPYDIRARDSQKQDELKNKILLHKKILEEAQDGAGMSVLLELLLQDFYTIPFGAGLEAIRYSRDRTLNAIKVLDGATLYPYNNDVYHVVQYVPEVRSDQIGFKNDELYRMLQFPRPELERYGWQIAPPEKIYLALELLNRGDKYYANLLIDTPEAGILDLGDMSKESAEKWLTSMRSLFTGIDPFKIPVLYEHTVQAKYLPFNRPPTEILFDVVTTKYAQLTCAAFGLTLGDIGMKSSNGSLSDSIRDERQSKSTGKAFVKRKIEELINKMLPDDLIFWFVDTDDELLVSKGRARSANAVAGRNLIESGALTPKEWRQQLKADGLITIPLPEEPDEKDFDIIKEISGVADQVRIQEEQLKIAKKTADNVQNANSAIHTKGGQAGFSLGKARNVRGGKLESVQGKEPTPASQGGQGEIKRSYIDEFNLTEIILDEFSRILENTTEVRIKRLIKSILSDYQFTLKSVFEQEDCEVWINNYELELFEQKSEFEDVELIRKSIEINDLKIKNLLEKETWWKFKVDSTELGDILIKSYVEGLKDAAEQIQSALYEENLSDELNLKSEFVLENEEILKGLYNRADELILNIDSGTQFYLSRLVSSTLNNGLVQYRNQFNDDLDILEIINSDEFLNLISKDFISGFNEILDNRLNYISILEMSKVYNEGLLKQFSTVGITKKYVVHIGEDLPCENCISNINVGEVELDFEYLTNYKQKSLVPLFHPNCDCILRFSKENLENITPNYFLGK